MADSKELKPVSYRLDEETKDKIKQIADDLNISQNATLQKLIETFELQKDKALISDTSKKDIIEDFEYHTSRINQSFISIMQSLVEADDKAEMKVAAKLQSKDTIIQDLQERLTVAKQMQEEATAKAKNYLDDNLQLNNSLENLKQEYESKVENLQAMLSDKDNLNKALTDSCNELKLKNESMREAAEQLTDAKKSLADLQSKYDKLLDTYNTLQADLSKQKATNDQILNDVKKQAKFDLDKAVFDLDKRYQEQIQSLQADKQAEIDKYQQKYFDLLQQQHQRRYTTSNIDNKNKHTQQQK